MRCAQRSESSPPSSSETGATSSRSAARAPCCRSCGSSPAGASKPGETDAKALKRELLHRLGVTIEPGQLISFVSHPYEKYAVDLYLYECTLVGGEPRTVNVADFRWVKSTEFERYPFTPADEPR